MHINPWAIREENFDGEEQKEDPKPTVLLLPLCELEPLPNL
jgi:hypothetical protein